MQLCVVLVFAARKEKKDYSSWRLVLILRLTYILSKVHTQQHEFHEVLSNESSASILSFWHLCPVFLQASEILCRAEIFSGSSCRDIDYVAKWWLLATVFSSPGIPKRAKRGWVLRKVQGCRRKACDCRVSRCVVRWILDLSSRATSQRRRTRPLRCLLRPDW